MNGFGALDRLIDTALEEDLFAGAAARVERRGAPVYMRTAGAALRTEAEREPMAEDTIFDLASLSKLFTATAALSLVQKGRWSLDTPAAEILGCGTGGLRAALGGIDLEALLTHASGIHYWYPFYTRGDESFETILADILSTHPPARKMVYSDLNFMILGRGLERATGKTLPEAMADLVFRPLGLETAHYRPIGAAAPQKPSIAAITSIASIAATEFGNRIERKMTADAGLAFSGWRDESRPIRGEADDGNCFYYFGGAAGHAGIFCGAKDVCRLGSLYLEGGRVGRIRILDQDLVARATRDLGAGRGLGFQLGENYPGGGCGHTGFTGTYLYINAAEGISCAILTNRLHTAAPKDLNPFRRACAAAILQDIDRH